MVSVVFDAYLFLVSHFTITLDYSSGASLIRHGSFMFHSFTIFRSSHGASREFLRPSIFVFHRFIILDYSSKEILVIFIMEVSCFTASLYSKTHLGRVAVVLHLALDLVCVRLQHELLNSRIFKDTIIFSGFEIGDQSDISNK